MGRMRPVGLVFEVPVIEDIVVEEVDDVGPELQREEGKGG
jgi:hypothetical protein